MTFNLITHLSHSCGYDAVFIIVDQLLEYATFFPCSTSSTALDLGKLFYDNIVCKIDMPV